MTPTGSYPTDGESLPHAAWALHKPRGQDRLCLGSLRPGMTREEVAALAGLYGAVEQVEDHTTRAARMASGFEGLEQFGLTPADIASARAGWEAVLGATQDLVTEYRGLGAPTLDYMGGRLSQVGTDHHCTKLDLQGHLVYLGDRLALLRALEAMEPEAVLRQGDTVWFPRLGVTVIGFYGDREDGTVGLLGEADDLRVRHLVLAAYKPVSHAPVPIPVTFHDAR